MQELTSNAFATIAIVLIIGLSLIFLLRKRRVTFDLKFHYSEEKNGFPEDDQDREVQGLNDAEKRNRDILP